jgi:hypothetical protein
MADPGGEVDSRQLKGKEGFNAEGTENAEGAERVWERQP